MSVAIRSIAPGDEEDWLRLWDGFFAHFGDEPRPRDICTIVFDRFFEDDPRNVKCLVAEYEGRVVGFVHYVFHRHGWWKEDICFLEDLFAEAALRGQGVGRALIQGVFAAAEEANCRSVYWWTQDDNPARPLYASLAGELRENYVRYRHVLDKRPNLASGDASI